MSVDWPLEEVGVAVALDSDASSPGSDEDSELSVVHSDSDGVADDVDAGVESVTVAGHYSHTASASVADGG